eukprot:scaffold819_cov350-Prasinococcus_capsulatus_cf.AAC.19
MSITANTMPEDIARIVRALGKPHERQSARTWLHAHEATAAHGHLERVEQLADIRHPLQAPLKFLERPSLNLIVAACEHSDSNH